MSELAKALLAFQKDAPTLVKRAEGQVRGRRDYKYLSLDDALAEIRPKLNEHGLIVLQLMSENGERHRSLHTVLCHAESDETEHSYVALPDTDDMQALGSAITYARRYSLIAMLGLVADEDDDGAKAQSRSEGAGTPAPPSDTAPSDFSKSTPVQKKRMKQFLKELKEADGEVDWPNVARTYMNTHLGMDNSELLDATQYEALLLHMQGKLEELQVPFS
jgi:ERF superfamily